MPEQYEFAGPAMTPDKAEEAGRVLKTYREVISEQKPRSAIEKSFDEEKAIWLIDDILKKEFVAMGIDWIPEIDADRFQHMSEQWFKSQTQKNTAGIHYPVEDQMAFNRGRAGSAVLVYKVIFHEAIHNAAKRKYWAKPATVDGKKGLQFDAYRGGYQSANLASPDGVHVHLVGFNEGVVEMTSQTYFHKYAHQIQEELAVTESEMDESGFAYEKSRAIIREIVRTLSLGQEIPETEVWKKIRKGQFTGEMMHLRDIEYLYGKGALRVLDALVVGSDESRTVAENQTIRRRNEKILEYFKSSDRPGDEKKTVRQALAREILGEEAFKKYCAEY